MQPFAFVGAGPAALVLAQALVRAFPERPLVLIDATPPDEDGRTFAFWSDRPTPYDPSVFAQWSTLSVFGADGTPARVDLGHGSYRAFDMGLWRAGMRTWLLRHGEVTWIEDTVQQVHERAGGVELRCAEHPSVQARFCFDSRYDPEPGGLIQSFCGWWVHTTAPRFADGPILMDFRLPADEGVRFWYVLPASPERALLMAVSFDERPHAVELEPYAALLGLGELRIERVEAGTLPMRTGPWERRVGDRQLRIGLAGGRLKASTGYGLTRFVTDSEHIVASLQQHHHPFDLPEEPRTASWMDEVFLKGVALYPNEAPAWFTALFSRVEAARLLRFLDGEGTLGDLAAVASALPLGRFLTLF